MIYGRYKYYHVPSDVWDGIIDGVSDLTRCHTILISCDVIIMLMIIIL